MKSVGQITKEEFNYFSQAQREKHCGDESHCEYTVALKHISNNVTKMSENLRWQYLNGLLMHKHETASNARKKPTLYMPSSSGTQLGMSRRAVPSGASEILIMIIN